MIRKYIIVADDSIKGFDEGIAKLEREWGAEEIEPSDDCISRQAVLRLVEQYPNIIGNRCVGLMADIKHLPSVTPSYNSVKTELDHVIDEIIIRIEQTRDKDKLCEYPYNRCINIIKEKIKNVN